MQKRGVFLSAATVIKEILSELNMTQTELAEAIGTTRQNLANKMTRDNFSAKELCAIGTVLNVKLTFKRLDGNEYVIEYAEDGES